MQLLTIQAKSERGVVLWPLLILLACAATLFAMLTGIDPIVGEDYIADDGPVQNGTLAILLVASLGAGCLAWRHRENRLNLSLLAIGLAIYAGREHDLHSLNSLPEHFTRWQFYVMPTVPVWQKLCFGLILLAVIGCIGLFIARMSPQMMHDLKQAKPWAVLGVIWLTALTASQISDRTWLNDTYAGRVFEETTELLASALALLVVWNFPRQADSPVTAATEKLNSQVPAESVPLKAS